MTEQNDGRSLTKSTVDATILALWRRYGGKAWEPSGGTNTPNARRLIGDGFVEVCDMRCGFEAFKDAGLRLTEAGKLAAQAIEARSGETRKRLDPTDESAVHAPEKE